MGYVCLSIHGLKAQEEQKGRRCIKIQFSPDDDVLLTFFFNKAVFYPSL